MLNPDAYRSFLLESYEAAWEDGIITEEELAELKSFQDALGISDEEAAQMNVDAVVKSASKDGEISEDEEELIKKVAKEAGVDSEEVLEEAKSKAKKGKKGNKK